MKAALLAPIMKAGGTTAKKINKNVAKRPHTRAPTTLSDSRLKWQTLRRRAPACDFDARHCCGREANYKFAWAVNARNATCRTHRHCIIAVALHMPETCQIEHCIIAVALHMSDTSTFLKKTEQSLSLSVQWAQPTRIAHASNS